jgi:hypothetical protein
MAVMSLDPTGTGRKRWMMHWKPALNAFEIASTVDSPPDASKPHQTQLHRLLDRPASDRTGAAPIGLVVEGEFRPYVPEISLEFSLRLPFAKENFYM